MWTRPGIEVRNPETYLLSVYIYRAVNLRAAVSRKANKTLTEFHIYPIIYYFYFFSVPRTVRFDFRFAWTVQWRAISSGRLADENEKTNQTYNI